MLGEEPWEGGYPFWTLVQIAANDLKEPNPAIDFSRCVCSQRKNFRSCIEDSATKQRTSRSFVTHKAKSSYPTYKLRDYR